VPDRTASRRRRPRGDGSLYRDSAGRWRATITVPDPITGRPRRKYLSGATEGEVRRKLAEAVRDRDRGDATGRTPTFAAWAERWLVRVAATVRPSTVAGYDRALRLYLVPRFGRLELHAIRPSDVETMTAELIAGGLHPATATLYRAVLSACLAAAVRDGLIVRNVVTASRPPRIPAKARRSLSPDELRRLLATAADDPVGPAVEVLAFTGLRRGELLGLAWADLDGTRLTIRRQLVRLDNRRYGLSEPKTASSWRTIVLPGRALDALGRQRARQTADRERAGADWQDRDGLIFTTPLGTPVHPVAFGSTFAAIATRAGLSGVTPHVLRHTAASAILAAGVPPRDAAEALGHSPAVLMRTYAHAMPGSRERVAAALERVIEEAEA